MAFSLAGLEINLLTKDKFVSLKLQHKWMDFNILIYTIRGLNWMFSKECSPVLSFHESIHWTYKYLSHELFIVDFLTNDILEDKWIYI